MSNHYDVVIIGAGSGGLTSAVGFTKASKRVLLVEREHMGGECTNSGCIPSKALLHHAKAFHAATAIAGETTQGEAYRAGAFTYVRQIVDNILAEETPETFAHLGIDVVQGEASFSGTNSIVVKTNTTDSDTTTLEGSETSYTFARAVIATGSRPRMITIPGLDETRILTNQNIFTLPDVPAKLLIIGGGPIGLEMAQAFALLGSQVTIVERGAEFAHQEDPAVRPIIRHLFERLGITIITNAQVTKVAGQTACIESSNERISDTQQAIEFDRVLVAVGRVPNLPIGLPMADIDATVDSIIVNNQYRTSNQRIYAVGDVAQALKFTHTADDTARQVVAHVISRGLLFVKRNKAIPKVTYTSPEIAQVGLSYDAAKKKYAEDMLMRIEVPFTQNDRAKTDSNTDGMLVVVTKRLSGRVVGAHIIGPAAGEILSVFTIAIDRNISLWKLQKTIFAYPTYSLIIKKAADQFVGQQLADLQSDLWNVLKRHAIKVTAATVWIGAITLLLQYQSSQGLTPTETSIRIFDFITLTAWGPLLYIVMYSIRPVTFFPATALTILAGIFFGFWLGTIYTLIAATLASAVAYTVGRFFSANVHLEDTILNRWITSLQHNTFPTILTMRLVFLPFDLVSYAAGILRARFIPFITATFLGILLGTATFVSIGASLDVEAFKANGISFSLFNPTFLLLAATIFILSLGVSKLVTRRNVNH